MIQKEILVNGKKFHRLVRTISLRELTNTCFHDLNYFYRPSHLVKLRQAHDHPNASTGDKFVCLELLKNACVAAAGILPSCQDTGTAIALASRGTHFSWPGSEMRISDTSEISLGVKDAYKLNPFRYSQVLPQNMYKEKNSGTNLPAAIDVFSHEEEDGPVWSTFPSTRNSFHLLCLAKGGGSANKTRFMAKSKSLLHPIAMRQFLKEQVNELGASACPPYHVGVAIGGLTPEECLKTAKLAASRQLPRLGAHNSKDAFIDEELGDYILDCSAKTGVGAQFLGTQQCLDATVVRLPRHGASCFIGVSVGCSGDRQIEAYVNSESGECFIEHLCRDPAEFLPVGHHQDSQHSSVELKIEEGPEGIQKLLQDINTVPIGSIVLISGNVLVARDMAHARFAEELKTTGTLPSYLFKYPVFYAGPSKTPEDSNMVIGSFGPTTSSRMDAYLPLLQPHGASLVTIGKGNRSEVAVKSCFENKGAYLTAVGGIGARGALKVREEKELDYQEFGMESVKLVKFDKLPCMVAINSRGEDAYEKKKDQTIAEL